MENTKHELIQSLKEHRQIATIQIEYDGYADSGMVSEINCLDKNGNSIPTTEHLTAAIDNYACSILPSGWQNGEGAFGTIELDAATGKSRVIHHERIVDTITNEFEV